MPKEIFLTVTAPIVVNSDVYVTIASSLAWIDKRSACLVSIPANMSYYPPQSRKDQVHCEI